MDEDIWEGNEDKRDCISVRHELVGSEDDKTLYEVLVSSKVIKFRDKILAMSDIDLVSEEEPIDNPGNELLWNTKWVLK